MEWIVFHAIADMREKYHRNIPGEVFAKAIRCSESESVFLKATKEVTLEEYMSKTSEDDNWSL